MKDQRQEDSPIGVLFVCLGNICRSPLAEGIFLDKIEQRQIRHRFVVDSCGTGSWHAGESADPRAKEVAARHGIHLPSVARQVDPNHDFERFDLLLAMDRSNHNKLLKLGANSDRVRMMREFDPKARDSQDLDVPDPYYGEGDGFKRVYDMLDAACDGLIDHLLQSTTR